ncbi:MAG TPA: hypothetical protein VM283_08385 [Armatimonadota bacterium]|nr:hypothetical protein [Armatimonadota bacterium]
MIYSRSQHTKQHRVCFICSALALVLSTSAFCAVPAPETRAPEAQRLDTLLTPEARIQLGVGRADQELLTRRAVTGSLNYPVISMWRGIVEYLFPLNGIIRRGDPIARIYDPSILADLERARRIMSIHDLSPITIAAPLPVLHDQPRSEPAPLVLPAPVPGPQKPAGIGRVETAPVRERPAAQVAIARQGPQFDFEANKRRQSELREQAQLTAEALGAAMQQRDAARAEVQAAKADLSARERLLAQGAIAEQALEAPRARVAQAVEAAEGAEKALGELQGAYAETARKIRALEQQAQSARAAIQAANEASRAAAAEARRARAQSEARSEPKPVAAAEPERVQLREEPAAERRPVGPALPGAGGAAPREVRDLAAPRYEEITSPGHAMIADVVSPQGKLVEVSEELLRLSNIQLAQLTARVPAQSIAEFREGRAVTLTFDDYPDAAFAGWVGGAAPVVDSNDVDVDLLVVCDSGAHSDDAYLALQWMVLEAGVEAKGAEPAVDPVMEPAPSSRTARLLGRFLPLIGPKEQYEERISKPEVARRDLYEGRLRLQPMARLAGETEQTDQRADERLAALSEWRRTYMDGMVTTILDDGTAITYPDGGEVSQAVRRMLTGDVSHQRNLCARTMREALGWGLGDASSWAWRLPHRGYAMRKDGLARPGDILVWPFTYGPGRSQHIGVAVRQGRRLVLLSNLSGRLGTTEILGGYLAFHRLDERPASDTGDTARS